MVKFANKFANKTANIKLKNSPV